MFEEILDDVSNEIANEVVLKYSNRIFATNEELLFLNEVVKAVAKSKIQDAFGPFANI